MNAQHPGTSLLEDHYDAFASRLLPVILGSNRSSTLGVIGANDGVGASTVSVQLAISISRLIERVLLMDAESANRSTSLAFQLETRQGLVQALSGEQEVETCIHDTHLPSLQVLPSGETNGKLLPAVRDPSGLQGLLDSLRDRYTVIVVDLPSAADHLAGMAFSTVTDGVLLVVESERSEVDSTRQITESFASVEANILGIILNKRRQHIPRWFHRRKI